MTDRERWTVYPLLFLALALILRDKVMPPGPSSLNARQLTIVGEDNRPNILLRGADNQGGSPAIEILNAKGNPAWIVGVRERDGVGVENTGTVIAQDLRIVGTDGKARVAMGITNKSTGAGRTEWFDANQNMVLAAGGAASDSGAITSFRPGNIPQFSFGTNERGSIVIVRDLKGNPYFVLMGDDQGVGRALLFDAEGAGQLIVGRPVNIQINEVPAAKTEGDGAAPTGEQKPADAQPNPDAPQEPASENPESAPAAEKPADEKPADAEPTPTAEPAAAPPAEEPPK